MAWVKVPRENHPLFLAALPKDARVETVTMFGGVAAKVNGKIFAGLFGVSTMVLLDDADRQAALKLPGAAMFDPMGDGRRRSDKVMLPASLMKKPAELRRWIARAFAFVAALPSKNGKPTKRAGYSGTPLVQKLGIEAGQLVALLHAPRGFQDTLGALPADVTLQRTLLRGKAFDVVVLFVEERAALSRQLAEVRRHMAPACGFWVAWPKKASGVSTDMSENVVRELALPTGMVDNKVCAIDDTWSGLRLVIRLTERKKPRPPARR